MVAVDGVGGVAEAVPPVAFVPYQFKVPPAAGVADKEEAVAF
jgi:hypothetical protein